MRCTCGRTRRGGSWRSVNLGNLLVPVDAMALILGKILLGEANVVKEVLFYSNGHGPHMGAADLAREILAHEGKRVTHLVQDVARPRELLFRRTFARQHVKFVISEAQQAKGRLVTRGRLPLVCDLYQYPIKPRRSGPGVANDAQGVNGIGQPGHVVFQGLPTAQLFAGDGLERRAGKGTD